MDYNEAYGQALRFLNVRFLSEGELRKKLKNKDIDMRIIEKVIIQLKEERFIDDMRLAYDVYHYFVKKEQYGHLYICERLKHRMLPIPEDLERIDEYAVAKKLLTKKFSQLPQDPRKIARFLQYRGFSLYIISDILGNKS
ncbi:MAG: recombination regulator RecX [Megasphaera sp.]|jgi:regulatory protein|uniref:regulatory protein RecX n=1 Tax=Megasphaera sueciensis TaxID=349094 RepID=UPI003D0141F5|nr:recombination regulator RecX [Megasphaera sp.]MCI1824066.1 recombination regulator RecX [Megasphaera sp.]